MPPAQNGRGLLRIESVVDSTANNVEQFVGDGLLTALVVLQIELAKQFVGIIRSRLHGHHASSMLRGHAVEECRVEHQVGKLRDELRENRVHVGLHDEVVVQRLHRFLHVILVSLATLLQILLALLRGDDRRQVAFVVALQLVFQVDGQEGLRVRIWLPALLKWW